MKLTRNRRLGCTGLHMGITIPSYFTNMCGGQGKKLQILEIRDMISMTRHGSKEIGETDVEYFLD